jgi:membrane protease YdiL (CAAX protease family)
MNSAGKHQHALVIAGYIAVVMLAGALFAPVLFGWGRWFLGVCQANGWDKIPSLSWFMVPLGKTQFRGYFDRAALVVALVALWPLFKLLNVQRAEVMGNQQPAAGWRTLMIGFNLATTLLSVLGVAYWLIGVCDISSKARWFAIGTPLVSAFTVACMEEFLFRGAVLGVLRRSLGIGSAVWLTTILFAFVHFLKSPADALISDAEVGWTSGLQILPQLLAGFSKWQNVLAEFFLLAAVGWVLVRVRIATNGLWGSIGLHAGWVFGMKYFSQITTVQPALHEGIYSPWIAENTCKAIVGSYVGLAPVAIILLTGFIMLRLSRTRGNEILIASRAS